MPSQKVKKTCAARIKKGGSKVLLYENAPIHRSNVGQVVHHKYPYEIVNHPPYNPDRALSD